MFKYEKYDKARVSECEWLSRECMYESIMETPQTHITVKALLGTQTVFNASQRVESEQ